MANKALQCSPVPLSAPLSHLCQSWVVTRHNSKTIISAVCDRDSPGSRESNAGRVSEQPEKNEESWWEVSPNKADVSETVDIWSAVQGGQSTASLRTHQHQLGSKDAHNCSVNLSLELLKYSQMFQAEQQTAERLLSDNPPVSHIHYVNPHTPLYKMSWTISTHLAISLDGSELTVYHISCTYAYMKWKECPMSPLHHGRVPLQSSRITKGMLEGLLSLMLKVEEEFLLLETRSEN